MKGRNERITKKQSNNGTVQQKRTDGWIMDKNNEMVLVILQNQFKSAKGNNRGSDHHNVHIMF